MFRQIGVRSLGTACRAQRCSGSMISQPRKPCSHCRSAPRDFSCELGRQSSSVHRRKDCIVEGLLDRPCNATASSPVVPALCLSHATCSACAECLCGWTLDLGECAVIVSDALCCRKIGALVICIPVTSLECYGGAKKRMRMLRCDCLIA